MLMFCASCGSQIEVADSFCSNCGTKIVQDIIGSSHTVKASAAPSETETCPQLGKRSRRGSRRFLPIGLTAGLVILVFVGVLSYGRLGPLFNVLEHQVSPEARPTQDQVKRDCDHIAAATVYHERRAALRGGVDRFAGKELPMFLCSEVKILGTSVEGKMADVVTEVTVKYTLDPFLGNMNIGGFFNWVNGRDWSSWDGFKSTRPRKGDTRLYRVTFKYRQFDTGWRLEDYR